MPIYDGDTFTNGDKSFFKSRGAKFLKTLDSFRGYKFYREQLEPTCIISWLDLSNETLLSICKTRSGDILNFSRTGHPVIFVVNGKSNKIIKNLIDLNRCLGYENYIIITYKMFKKLLSKNPECIDQMCIRDEELTLISPETNRNQHRMESFNSIREELYNNRIDILYDPKSAIQIEGVI